MISPYNKSKSVVVDSSISKKYQPQDKSRLDHITEENSDSTPLRFKPDDLDSLLDDDELNNHLAKTEKKNLRLEITSPLLNI
jgi:hypothetical protein